jgi:hypothetical protein
VLQGTRADCLPLALTLLTSVTGVLRVLRRHYLCVTLHLSLSGILLIRASRLPLRDVLLSVGADLCVYYVVIRMDRASLLYLEYIEFTLWGLCIVPSGSTDERCKYAPGGTFICMY